MAKTNILSRQYPSAAKRKVLGLARKARKSIFVSDFKVAVAQQKSFNRDIRLAERRAEIRKLSRKEGRIKRDVADLFTFSGKIVSKDFKARERKLR